MTAREPTGSPFRCACAPGFSGTTCQTSVDDCAGNPCLNGGTCTDGANSFTCACAPGYSGTTCQTNVNECAPNPCLNGGTCTDGVNSFTCACTGGFTGTTCTTAPTSCAAIKAGNAAAADGVYVIDPDATYIDSLAWGLVPNDSERYFADYAGGIGVNCYAPAAAGMRCFNSGVSTGHAFINDISISLK